MSLEPKSLQFLMIVRTERVALKDPVQFLKMSPMKGDDRLGFQDALVSVQPSARRQGPQESTESLHGASLLENLDRRHHRLEDDRQGGHTVSRQNSSRSPLILVYLVCFSIVINNHLSPFLQIYLLFREKGTILLPIVSRHQKLSTYFLYIFLTILDKHDHFYARKTNILQVELIFYRHTMWAILFTILL